MHSTTPTLTPTTPASLPGIENEANVDIQILFDTRPEDNHQPKGVISAALSAISSAYRSAGQFITTILEKLGLHRSEAVMDIQISRPENVRKPPLPADILNEISKIEAEKRSKAKEVAEKNFVQGVGSNTELPIDDLDEDCIAFDQYVRLCKADTKESGTALCPVNFKTGAQRHAENIIKLVSERKQHAQENQKEYWLSVKDQDRLKAAQYFLQTHSDSTNTTINGDLDVAEPMSKNSSVHLLSFNEWRRWKSAPSKENFVPIQSDLRINDAVKYAETLIATYAGKEIAAINKDISELLNDAAELIGRQGEYRAAFDNAWDMAELINNIDPGVREQKGYRPNGLAESLGVNAEHDSQSHGLQASSFAAWQKWQRDSNYLPEESNLTIDAAIQYAKILLEGFKDKDPSIVKSGESIFNDASDLIKNHSRYRVGFNGACETATIRNAANEQAKKILEAEQAAEVVQGDVPPINPGSISSSVGAKTGIALEPSANPAPSATQRNVSAEQASRALHAVAADAPLPAVSAPDVRRQSVASAALPESIPNLQTLDPSLQAHANTLLKEYFMLHAAQTKRGNSKFDDDGRFFTQLSASAATAYLKRLNESDSLSIEDIQQTPLANRIVTEYLRRQNPGAKIIA